MSQTDAGRGGRPVGGAGRRGAAGSASVAGVDVHAPGEQPPEAGRGEAQVPLGGAGDPGRDPRGAHLPAHVVLVVPPIPRRSRSQFKGNHLTFERPFKSTLTTLGSLCRRPADRRVVL